MKKIIICFIVFLSVFVIYLANMDKKVYYLALGDSNKKTIDCFNNEVKGYSYYVKEFLDNKGVLEKYVYGYSKKDKRITEIINDIDSNKKYKKFTLKNALVKADLVTLSINVDDVFLKLSSEDINYNDFYNYIDDLSTDFEKLIKLIREYCKEDIIFIGYYNPFNYKNDSDIQDVIDYINRKYKDVCDEYDVSFLDISDFDNNYLSNNSYYLNKDGYKEIGIRVSKLSQKIIFNT